MDRINGSKRISEVVREYGRAKHKNRRTRDRTVLPLRWDGVSMGTGMKEETIGLGSGGGDEST